MNLSHRKRIYSIHNPIVAITGGIATGKSTICELIKEKGLPVIGADQQIKLIYQEEQMISLLKKYVPQVLSKEDQVDFNQLRTLYFEKQELRDKLNAYIYDRLQNRVRDFCHSFSPEQIIFYEVPLLFEKELETKVDFSVVIYADRQTQIQRVQKRDGSTLEVINKILDSQLPIEEKRKQADFVVDNSTHDVKTKHRQSLANQIDEILSTIQEEITQRSSFA